MDIKHRDAYARIKLYGTKDAILVNDGMSLMRLLMGPILKAFQEARNQYGPCTIEIDFAPMGMQLTSTEKSYQEILGGIDPSMIEYETEEEAANPKHWNNSPANPDSPTYDPLYKEWYMCGVRSHRDTKTPEDLAILRRHMDTHYIDSIWWDRSHRW